MKRSVLLAVVLSAAASGALACSSSSSDATPSDGGGDGALDGGGVTIDQACADVAGALCDKIATCSPLYLQIGYGDATKCKTEFKPGCVAGLSATGTGSTPQILEGCVPAANAATCVDLFSNRFPAACLPVAGTLTDGSACGDDAQCVSKYCSTSDTTICGKCGAAPVAGGSCATQKCGTGFVCVANACIVPGIAGATCSATAPCENDLSCTDGKCGAPAINVGDACDFNGAGKPTCDLINKGLFCLQTTGKCVAVKISNVGEACGYDATTSVVSACIENGVCKKAKPADLAGTCIADSTEGQPCSTDDTVGPKCRQDLKCVSGTCTASNPATCK